MHRHEFCTYFDSGYLGRALVLHRSLIETGISFRLSALCLDDEAYRAIADRRDETFRPVTLASLEDADPALLEAKATRSKYEYYFTVGPSLLRHLLATDDLDSVTYLDADMCFYSSPEPLFAEASEAATVIVGHRFPDRLRHLERTGRFNVAWVGFRNDVDGLTCLEWWRERCLEWCHDRVEASRYADQKYLDRFPESFRRVHELRHPGADVAPWNVADPPLEWDGHRFVVGGEPLVFFHFQGLKRLDGWTIDPNLAEYGNRATSAVRRLYRGYVERLESASHGLPVDAPRRESTPGRWSSVGRLFGTLRGRVIVAPRRR